MSATPPRVPRLAELLPDRPVVPRRTAPVASGGAGSDAPLAGVKVLDLGVVIAGAYAATILAGLGADVVKIETPSGDPFRSYGTTFCSYNRGKRSLVLDLKRADAKQVFFELVAQADVVLDNYRLGVRQRLGISYETLRTINPRDHLALDQWVRHEGSAGTAPGLRPPAPGAERADAGARGLRIGARVPPHRGERRRQRRDVGVRDRRCPRRAYRDGGGSGGSHEPGDPERAAPDRRADDVSGSSGTTDGRARLHRRQRARALLRVCRRMDRHRVFHPVALRGAGRCARVG